MDVSLISTYLLSAKSSKRRTLTASRSLVFLGLPASTGFNWYISVRSSDWKSRTWKLEPQIRKLNCRARYSSPGCRVVGWKNLPADSG